MKRASKISIIFLIVISGCRGYRQVKESFICYISPYSRRNELTMAPTFFILSKHDGSVIKEIEIPFEQPKTTVELLFDRETMKGVTTGTPYFFPMLYCKDLWLLTEPSADTVYKYLPDHSKIPFLTRTPSIQTMNPEVFLLPGIITDRYCFMHLYTKEFDFVKLQPAPEKDLMYDRQMNTIFEYIAYNEDYANQKRISLTGRSGIGDIAFWKIIEAYELVEDYKKGVLKGRLKEIAATLDEEDNPVIMLAKHKK